MKIDCLIIRIKLIILYRVLFLIRLEHNCKRNLQNNARHRIHLK